MNFTTLENLSTAQIADLFNRSFADYFVQIHLSPEILLEKMTSEDVLPSLSMGAFENGEPVGFMLHAFRNIEGRRIAYNAGTGVLKEFRGQNVTVKMYKHLLPLLRENGVNEVELEVIDRNEAAIRSYEKAGFIRVANLDCFMGIPETYNIRIDLAIKEIQLPDTDLLETFRNWQPTWQNAAETIRKIPSLKTYGAFRENELAGFITVSPERARVLQFAVAPGQRKKGIGHTLFHYFARTVSGVINVNNINDSSGETQVFLQKIGLKHYLTQYKMKLDLL